MLLFLLFAMIIWLALSFSKSQEIEGLRQASDQWTEQIASTVIYEGEFHVAGTSFNPEGVTEMIKFIYSSGDGEPYGGYSGQELRELLEYGEPVYKYGSYQTSDISFVPEPKNEYDSEAILVFVGDCIDIGYVPRVYTTLIHNALQRDDIKIDVLASITGGPYKKLDLIEDKIVNGSTSNIGVKLRITISEVGKSDDTKTL